MNPAEVVIGGVAIGVTITALVLLVLTLKDYPRKPKGGDGPPGGGEKK